MKHRGFDDERFEPPRLLLSYFQQLEFREIKTDVRQGKIFDWGSG